jgi:hypothetical protein
MFKDGQRNEQNVQDKKCSGQPSVENDDLFGALTKICVKDGASQFLNF